MFFMSPSVTAKLVHSQLLKSFYCSFTCRIKLILSKLSLKKSSSSIIDLVDMEGLPAVRFKGSNLGSVKRLKRILTQVFVVAKNDKKGHTLHYGTN